MPLLDSGWVSLSPACIVGPRKGLPIPPGPSGHWLFGIPLSLGKYVPSYMHSTSTQTPGPVISLSQGQRPSVIIGRYQAAMGVMEKQGASFADKPSLIAAGRPSPEI